MAKSRLYMTVCHLSMMGVISILVLQFPIVTQTLSALHYNFSDSFLSEKFSETKVLKHDTWLFRSRISNTDRICCTCASIK